MKIATLGPSGTYSEFAAKLFAKRQQFKESAVEIITTTINNSLRLVQNNESDYAVIPVENMIDGLIGSSFDALLEYQDFVKVCDEIHLPISHVLATPQDTVWKDITKIYSHPSPFNQCQNNLEEIFPNVDKIAVASTTEAIQYVLNDTQQLSAAICSKKAAVDHQLAIFGQEIQDYPFNETRFLVCSLHDGKPTGDDRTLLAVRYGTNQPGQLYQTAKYFAENDIDLTYIQSRPYKIKPQEYVLFYEFIGHKSNFNAEMALKNIEHQVRITDGWKKILGSYPKREREDIDGIK